MEMLVDRDWYEVHKGDHTQKELEGLGMELFVDGHKVGEIKNNEKKKRGKSHRQLYLLEGIKKEGDICG